jgi:hypothetical protein
MPASTDNYTALWGEKKGRKSNGEVLAEGNRGSGSRRQRPLGIGDREKRGLKTGEQIMAIPIKRIEKDFMLKAVYDEQIPLICLRNRAAYSLILEKPAGAELCLASKQFIPELKETQKL